MPGDQLLRLSCSTSAGWKSPRFPLFITNPPVVLMPLLQVWKLFHPHRLSRIRYQREAKRSIRCQPVRKPLHPHRLHPFRYQELRKHRCLFSLLCQPVRKPFVRLKFDARQFGDCYSSPHLPFAPLSMPGPFSPVFRIRFDASQYENPSTWWGNPSSFRHCAYQRCSQTTTRPISATSCPTSPSTPNTSTSTTRSLIFPPQPLPPPSSTKTTTSTPSASTHSLSESMPLPQ